MYVCIYVLCMYLYLAIGLLEYSSKYSEYSSSVVASEELRVEREEKDLERTPTNVIVPHRIY